MKCLHVEICPDRLNFPLAPLSVGRLSSNVLEIGGDIPDDVAMMSVQVERSMRNGAQDNFVAVATEVEGASPRRFRCYLSPFLFPDVSSKLNFHVVGTDEKVNKRWLGSGPLRVLPNPANGNGVAPEIIPSGSYAYNPTTNLYHRIIASVNELGEIRLEAESEGVEL